MGEKPVGREESIVTLPMLLKIVLHGLFMAALVLGEYLFDFIGAGRESVPTVIFCMFVLFQLFNAFNCRKPGSESLFSAGGRNGLMPGVFAATFAFQVAITQFLGGFFGTTPLSFSVWLKTIAVSSTVILFSECCKLLSRAREKLRGGLRRNDAISR